jgi:hypothetical protein
MISGILNLGWIVDTEEQQSALMLDTDPDFFFRVYLALKSF